ncbi:MAG: D-2-hydroxyacid dehydrogenase, partial [Thermomicrobiales bacterium]
EHHAWREWGALEGVFELTDQTLVLAGLGAIGLEIARRAKPFGMHIIGVRRTDSSELPANVDEIVTIAELDSVLARADHVVNSLPFTPATGKLFDADRFAATKQGAHFYNLGRGTTVDQLALIEALESGHLGGAGLDVTDPEPLPETSPLWDMENVIITSHSSGHSPRMLQRRYDMLCENIRRYLAHEEMLNVVDQSHGY